MAEKPKRDPIEDCRRLIRMMKEEGAAHVKGAGFEVLLSPGALAEAAAERAEARQRKAEPQKNGRIREALAEDGEKVGLVNGLPVDEDLEYAHVEGGPDDFA